MSARPARLLILSGATLVTLALASVATAATAGTGVTYSAGTPQPAKVASTSANPAPWTLAQSGAVYPGATTTPGSSPYQTGYSGTPGPLAGYCTSGGASPESGAPVNQPIGSTLVMSPYYFPHVERVSATTLQGFFDYRPKDVTEAVVAAKSTDNGATWTVQGKALEENAGLCPNGNTDTNAATESDDGQGHPFDLTVGGQTYLYTLNRPSGDTLGVNLLAHKIDLTAANPLAGLPASEPTGLGGATTTTAAGTVTSTLGGTSTTSLPVGSTDGAEIPDRVYVTGSVGGATAGPTPVYCSGSTATAFTGCYTTAGGDLSYASGAAVSADPVVPATATATSGLTSPDGILAIVPKTYPAAGEPSGATTVLYVDKQLSYYTPTTVSAKVTLPLTNGALPLTNPTQYSAPVTVYVASTDSSLTPVAVTCTGTNSAGLTGCTSSGTGNTGTVASGNSVGSPGSCIVSSSSLATIGEGSTKPKTLFKNNEDYAAVQMAWTTDGTTFHDITSAVGGINGLANPADQTGLRWAAPSGTIITNPDGSLGIFYSAGVCTDGDSDAFGSLYYSSSTDGTNWSTPTKISSTDPLDPTLTTDYTFAGSRAAQGGGAQDASTYYGGRIYSPSVVQNPDGSLSMIFAGYRTPKPLPAVGSSLGTAATQYTVSASDPAEYRTIMTVTLTPTSASPTPSLPESPLAVGLPLVGGLVLLGSGLLLRRRRLVRS